MRTGPLKEALDKHTGRRGKRQDNNPLKTDLLPYTLAADLIPVQKIENGILVTKDGRYLKIIEVFPVNFLMRSAREQRFVIQAFCQWLKVAPCRFQIRTVARRADIGKYLQKAKEEMEGEENDACKRLQEDYMGLLQNVGLKEAISRRFFLILEYDDPEGRRAEKEDIAAAFDKLGDTAK